MGESSFRRVLAVLRARWLIVSALMLPVVFATTLFAAGLDPAFRSVVVLTFSPNVQSTPDNGFVRLLPRYAATATAPAALRSAEEAAGLTGGTLDDSVTADLPRGTLELTMTVTTSASESSVAAAQSLARSVIDTAGSDPSVSAHVVQQPKRSVDTAPRRLLVAMAVGWLLAAVLAGTVAIAMEAIRPRVRVSDDLARPGIPVLPPLPLRRARNKMSAMAAEGSPSSFSVLVLALARRVQTEPDPDGRPVVVVTSTQEDATGVERVVHELRQCQDVSATGAAPGAVFDIIAAPPIFPTREVTIESLSNRPCVLVVRAGTPRDRLDQCLVILNSLGAPILGTVLAPGGNL